MASQQNLCKTCNFFWISCRFGLALRLRTVDTDTDTDTETPETYENHL